MNTKDTEPDELDKFVIKGLDEYLDSNPELSTIKLVQLLSESILHLRKYIENPKEKYTTWDRPAIELKYAVEFSDNDKLPETIYTEDTQDKNTEEVFYNTLFHEYPLSVLLREMSDSIVVFKEGDKIEALISPQNKHLKKLTGAERERYLRELGEKYFSDNKKPTLALDFKLEFSDDKEPKRRRKTARGKFILDVSPLYADEDSRKASYSVITGLDIKEYKPINWSKEEKKEFWEALDKTFKTYTPQKSFDFLEKLIEPEVKPVIPEVKPVIKDKGEVYKYPKDLANVTQAIFTNTPFRDRDFKGFTNERGKDEAKWQKKEITALVPTEDLSLFPRKKKHVGQGYLIPTPPKIAGSGAKNVDTLVCMLQKENRKRGKTGQDKTGNLDFSLKEYAKMRGKSESRLDSGGKFVDELKKDLISGGITSYIVDLEEATGRKSYLIQNFYGLEVPKTKSKEKWRVIFNEPYKTDILNSKQYYPMLLKAIQDPKTDGGKVHLYFFYKVVMSYASNNTDFKGGVLKVSTLLDKIKIGDETKAKPQRAFKVLCECIYYMATNFEGIIKEVKFYNNGKREKVKLITDLEKFKEWDYNDFKNEVLNGLGLTDIREALVSFNSTPQKELAETMEEPKQTGEYKTTL